MNKIYGGFVSSPVNQKDTTVSNNTTITFSGTIVETPTIIPDPIESPEFAYYKNIVGSYVYSDRTLGSEVKSNIVGVVAIPANACPDGKARIIPIDGARNNLKWTNSEFYETDDILALGVQAVNEFSFVNNGTNVYSTIQSFTDFYENRYYLPLFWVEASQSMLDMWNNDGLTVIRSTENSSLYTAFIEGDYGENNEYLCILPAPYLEDGTVNPMLSQTANAGQRLVTTDWTSGDANKAALSSNSELFAFANSFSKEGFPAGSWTIPTATELLFIYAKYETIRDAITKAGGDTSWMLTSSAYKTLWSSTFLGYASIPDDTGGVVWEGRFNENGPYFFLDYVDSSYSDTFGLPLAKLN